MNREEFDDMKEKYFSDDQGKEEGQFSALDKAYFDALKGEKEVKMDWDFDAFLQTTEEKEEQVGIKLESKKPFQIGKVIYWAAASIALIFASTVFINQHREETRNSLGQLDLTPTEQPGIVEVEQPENTAVSIETTKTNEVKKVKPYKNTPSSHKLAYNPEYVEINGKPVDDEEEAIKLVMQSLGKFASKVEQSVSTMENVKYLSIKI